MCFVPMNLGPAYLAVGNPNKSDALEFAPMAFAVPSLQTGKISDCVANRNDFDILNLVNDFKVH